MLSPYPVLLFDGVCNLCNKAVQLVIRNDRDAQFKFAALQSENGQLLLRQHGLAGGELTTLVLVENDRAYTRSTAALRIARRLGGLWPLLYPLVLLPEPLRDSGYNFIARNRYRWFGKEESCMLPDPELKARFL